MTLKCWEKDRVKEGDGRWVSNGLEREERERMTEGVYRD